MRKTIRQLLVHARQAILLLRRRVSAWLYPYPDPEEEARAEELQRLRDNERFQNDQVDELAKQLHKDRKELWRWRNTPTKYRDALGDLMALPISKLRERAKFDTFWDDGQWQVVTGICNMGGCDMGVFTFPDERDALIFSAALDVVGYKFSRGICSDCYAEYREWCA